MENKIKYEVAFSFLSQDENLANELNSLISERVSTFIYSEQQKKLVGTDGEHIFNKVFYEEARLVVVLYRKGWGETTWTRIEETAIKNRAFNDGYDFTIFIPLDNEKTVPKYLPKTRIWGDIDRWGVKGATSIIEARVNSLGGILRGESPEDLALRIKRDQEFETKRTNFLNSSDGLQNAFSESQNLFNILEVIKNNIEKESSGFQLGYNKKNNYCILFYEWVRIKFEWHTYYNNSLDESYLYFCMDSPNRSPEPPSILKEEKYQFDINKFSNYGWIKNNDRNSFISSEKLADDSVKLLLSKVSKNLEEKKSKNYL
jgi:hypothetical protein